MYFFVCGRVGNGGVWEGLTLYILLFRYTLMALSLYLILSKCNVIKLLLIILKPLVLEGDKTKFRTGGI